MQFIQFVFAIGVGLSLAACGGGGSSSSSGSGIGADIIYSGRTEQVLVNTSNGKTLTTGTMGNVQLNTASGVSLRLTEKPQTDSYTYGVARFVVDATYSATSAQIAAKGEFAARSISGSDTCPDGGSFSFSFDNTEGTNQITGNLTFAECVNAGVTVNGSVNVAGSINEVDGLQQITITFNTLNVKSSEGDFTIRGSYDALFSGTEVTLTINTLISDNANNSVEKLENLRFVFNNLGGDDTLSIQGRYYHPDHGYVEISTTTEIRILATDIFPYSGQLLLQGTANTSARVTFISSTQYTLEIDANGDGVYETVSTESW